MASILVIDIMKGNYSLMILIFHVKIAFILVWKGKNNPGLWFLLEKPPLRSYYVLSSCKIPRKSLERFEKRITDFMGSFPNKGRGSVSNIYIDIFKSRKILKFLFISSANKIAPEYSQENPESTKCCKELYITLLTLSVRRNFSK